MRHLKLITFIAFTIFGVLIFFIIAAFVFPWMKKVGPMLLQLYSKISLKIFGVSVASASKIPFPAEKDKGIILIANHVSSLDIFLMSALYRTVYLSKEEVKHYPVIGLVATLIGIFFLKRESSFDRHRMIRKIARQSNGRIITIFPQGTTSSAEKLLPFKRGIFKTVELNHGAVLLPVTIRYKEEREIVWKREQNLLENLKAICAEKEISVKVTIHEPMSIHNYSDKTVAEICSAAQERVFSLLSAGY